MRSPRWLTGWAASRRAVLAATAIAAFAAFCIVQDRITADGARRYVALQREALAGRGPRVTIEEVMRPAIDRSVRNGLLAAGGVACVGALLAWRLGKQTRQQARRSRTEMRRIGRARGSEAPPR